MSFSTPLNTLVGKISGSVKGPLLVISVAAAFSGCATAPEKSDTATHYWFSETSKPKREYNNDNTNCMQQSDTEKAQPLETDSPSYQAYRDCMIQNGYTLRRY